MLENFHQDKFWQAYRAAFELFKRKRGTTLAAASSFYVILTSVPLFLLFIRLLGWAIGDVKAVQELIFTLGKQAFPDVAPDILLKIKGMLQGPLFGKASFTFINFFILLASSLTFFNSIWSALYLFNEDKKFISWKKYLKGLVLIGVTVLVLLLAFSFQPIMVFLIKALKYNFLMEFIYENLESLRGIITYLRKMNPNSYFPFMTDLLHFVLFIFYFAFTYLWFFNWKIGKREALLASGTFVALMILGKNLFWIYFFYLRTRLIHAYGDFYTVVVGVIWIYLVMCFFYFGVSLCVEFKKNPLFKGKKSADDANQVES